MMTDKDNWQEKPGEGENAARRDGERNQENSGNEANPWRKPADSRSSQGSYDRTRKHNSDTKGGFNRGGNSFDRSRRSFGDDNNRPPRSGNSDGNSFNNNFSRPRPFAEGDNERPRRPFGDAGNDRPRSSFGDSGNRFGASSRDGNSLDRPKRNYNDSNYSRPSRPFGQSEGDRPRRPFSEGNNDRPQRSYGDTGNRFGPSNQEGGFAKPRRTFGESESERPRRPFSEGSNDRPRRSFGDNGNRFGSTDRDGNSFDRPRRPFTEGGSDRPRHTVGDGTFKPSFNGPSLPKPDRSDGRPRRPRIKLESRFDHGTPSNRPTGGFQQPLDPNVPLRLNKFLANAGICSRREADEFIQAGVVKVNGETVTELGVKVKPIDTILFHDQQVSIERKVYILLNKPKDCVTTSDDPLP